MSSKELKEIKEHELIIDRNTNLLGLINRNKYTKLHLKKHLLKMNLNTFKNVKELTYEYHHDYLSEYINKLSFKENLEKLTFKGMEYIGTDYHTILKLPNLKSIEFPETIENIYGNYLVYSRNLKEIIFNISNNTQFLNDSFSSKKYLNLDRCNLEKIIIKTDYKDYDIFPDYMIEKIGNSGYFNEEGIILNYKNYYIETKVNIRNDKVSKINKLVKLNDEFIKDGCFCIPDYINSIDLNGQYNFLEINSISLNLNLLKSEHINKSILNTFIPDLKKVIIRNDNEMNLFPNIIISEEEYGKIYSVFIKNKELNICFKDKMIIIDSNGIKRIDEGIVIPEEELAEDKIRVTENNLIGKGERVKLDIKKYASTQLEYYSYYKKLLELLKDDDKELDDAMEIVEDRLIKKLKIDE